MPRHACVIAILALLLQLLPADTLCAQSTIEYRLLLHGDATLSLTRSHDSLLVAVSAPGSTRIVYRCERPLSVARFWGDIQGSLTVTPGPDKDALGSGKEAVERNTCGVAVLETRPGVAGVAPSHYFEIALSVFHLIVPLTNDETQVLLALLRQTTA